MGDEYLIMPQFSDDLMVEVLAKADIEYKIGSDWVCFEDFFIGLDDEFHFTLDACASKSNHVCEKYYTIEDDGLKQDWSGEVVWCNPWYNTTIVDWVEKCFDEAQKWAFVVLLVPFKPDDTWWMDYVIGSEFRVFDGRCNTPGMALPAGMQCAIVIFRGHDK